MTPDIDIYITAIVVLILVFYMGRRTMYQKVEAKITECNKQRDEVIAAWDNLNINNLKVQKLLETRAQELDAGFADLNQRATLLAEHAETFERLVRNSSKG